MHDTDSGFGRRSFLGTGFGALAGASLSAAGCGTPPDTLPPLDFVQCAGCKADTRPETFSVRATIRPGGSTKIRNLLSEGGVFEHDYPGIHSARLALLSEDKLLIAVIYDHSRETAVNFLTKNGKRLDLVLQECVGYTPGTAEDPVRLDAFLCVNDVPNMMFYTAYQSSSAAVRQAVAMRAGFIDFLRTSRTMSERQLGFAFERFIQSNRAELHAGGQGPRPICTADLIPPGPQHKNALTMIQTIKPGKVRRKELCPETEGTVIGLERRASGLITYKRLVELILTSGEWAMRDLGVHPLSGLHTLHFARATVIDGDRMLFSSVYDGDWSQYIFDFRSKIADEMDELFCATVGYPKAGSRDLPGFMEWIRRGQVDVQDFYTADDRITLKQIEASTEFCARLTEFTRDLSANPQVLSSKLRNFVAKYQCKLS